MDILTTIPLHKLELMKEEDKALHGLSDEECNWFWKLNPKPKDLDVGDRIYFIEDGCITAWCPVMELGYFDFVCEFSGERWSGYQARLGQNREFLSHIGHRGFQGWRYLKNALRTQLDTIETRSSYTPPQHGPRSHSDIATLKVLRTRSVGQINFWEFMQVDAQKNNQRVIVSVQNRRFAEDLCDYLKEQGYNARFFHKGIPSRERRQLAKECREKNTIMIVAETLEGLPRPHTMLIFGADDQENELRTKEWLTYFASFATTQVIVCADTLTKAIKSVFPHLK